MDEYISYDLSLDVSSAGCDKQINVVQGERNSRFLYVTLTDGARKIELNPVTDIAVVRGVKTDDTVILNPAYILTDSRIYYKFGVQDTAATGDSVYAIQIIRIDGDDKRILHTVFFKVHVGETLYNDEKITSANEYGILIEEINKIDDAIYVDEQLEYKEKKVSYDNTTTKISMWEDVRGEDDKYIVIDAVKKVTNSGVEDGEIKGLQVGYYNVIYEKNNHLHVAFNDVYNQKLPFSIKKTYVPSSQIVGDVGIILDGAYDTGECWIKYYVCRRMTLNSYIEEFMDLKNQELYSWKEKVKYDLTNDLEEDISEINRKIDVANEKADEANSVIDESKAVIDEINKKLPYIDDLVGGIYDSELSDISENAVKNKIVKQAVDTVNGRIDNLLTDYSEDNQYVEATFKNNLSLSVSEMNLPLSDINEEQSLAALSSENIVISESGTYVISFNADIEGAGTQYATFEIQICMLVNDVEKMIIHDRTTTSEQRNHYRNKLVVVKLKKGDVISFLWKGTTATLKRGSVFMFMIRESGEIVDARVDALGVAHKSAGEAIRYVGGEVVDARRDLFGITHKTVGDAIRSNVGAMSNGGIRLDKELTWYDNDVLIQSELMTTGLFFNHQIKSNVFELPPKFNLEVNLPKLTEFNFTDTSTNTIIEQIGNVESTVEQKFTFYTGKGCKRCHISVLSDLDETLTVEELAAKISVSANVTSKSSENFPFKAVYGETLYTDIVQAIEDGREVSCTQERAGIKMNLCYTGMNLTTNTLSFQNTQGDMIYGANILENNTWQMYSIKLSEEIAQKNLFVATYGETTYKEVLDNYNSGNQIFLTVPGSVVDGSADGSIHIATLTTLNQEKGYVFFDFDTGISHYSCGLNKNSQWGCERTLLTTSQQFEAFQTSTTTSLEKLKTFTAIFNVTKFSAIQSAYNQGKRIVLEDGWLKGELNILSPNSYAQFSALDDMGNPVTFKVTTDDVWKKTSTTHVPLKDFDNFTVNAEYSIKFLNDKITDNSDQISKIFTNYVPKITDIDYEILSAGERYYISKPGLYLFVGNDYDLNLYNHNQNADSSAILGNSKNLIIAMIVAENKNDNKFFRTFYGKTYKKLGIATPESSVVDLRRYSGDSNFAYVHNTSTNGNATIFYIKPQS